MCTDAYVFTHYKLTAYFHPRDIKELGRNGIFRHGLELICTLCLLEPEEHVILSVDLLYI